MQHTPSESACNSPTVNQHVANTRSVSACSTHTHIAVLRPGATLKNSTPSSPRTKTPLAISPPVGPRCAVSLQQTYSMSECRHPLDRLQVQYIQHSVGTQSDQYWHHDAPVIEVWRTAISASNPVDHLECHVLVVLADIWDLVFIQSSSIWVRGCKQSSSYFLKERCLLIR